MITKCTMIIELATNTSDPNLAARRLGGWSESWYDDGTPPTRVRLAECVGCRGALLPRGGAVVGQRYQQLNPTGPSQSTSNRFPGNALLGTDQPQSSLLCKVPGIGVRNVRPMLLRGIPDTMCVEGEFSPSPEFQTALNNFFLELKDYQFHGKDLSLTKYTIFSIASDGSIENAHGWQDVDGRTVDVRHLPWW